ncbi:hypothetical protein [Thalassotalea sp. PLHSN55]|uniref:hypothetical protein n=1 Tax=Thalassotalea sp. PLHSN55 TaxID=3435888 RepID=UPI003F85A3CE
MNKVAFHINQETEYGGFEYSTVSIIIDGRPLPELMKKIEMKMAEKEGHPDIAGNYGTLTLPSNPHDYYLGLIEADEGENEDKSTLLDCACGCFGCWPLLCNISITNNKVSWTHFEQPQRGNKSEGSHWSYEDFNGFVFDKEQYLKALEVFHR